MIATIQLLTRIKEEFQSSSSIINSFFSHVYNTQPFQATHTSIQRRTNILTGEDDVTLREGLNRPMEMSHMYGIVGERKPGLASYCTLL